MMISRCLSLCRLALVLFVASPALAAPITDTPYGKSADGYLFTLTYESDYYTSSFPSLLDTRGTATLTFVVSSTLYHAIDTFPGLDYGYASARLGGSAHLDIAELDRPDATYLGQPLPYHGAAPYFSVNFYNSYYGQYNAVQLIDGSVSSAPGDALLFHDQIFVPPADGGLFGGYFKPGTYSGDNGFSSLTISPLAVSAVPEPAGWALAITGVVLCGAVTRRRRSRAIGA